jgi:hypothetical protein
MLPEMKPQRVKLVAKYGRYVCMSCPKNWPYIKPIAITKNAVVVVIHIVPRLERR